MTKPTEGPWYYEAGHIMGADLKPVADLYACRRSVPEEAAANARLLAASWEMRELLVKISAHGLREDPDGNGLSRTDKRAGELAYETRALLARIDGDTE